MEKWFEEFTNFIVMDLFHQGTFCFWFVSVEDNHPLVFHYVKSLGKKTIVTSSSSISHLPNDFSYIYGEQSPAVLRKSINVQLHFNSQQKNYPLRTKLLNIAGLLTEALKTPPLLFMFPDHYLIPVTHQFSHWLIRMLYYLKPCFQFLQLLICFLHCFHMVIL